MALDYAAAVNAEIKDLFAACADIVQIDEPRICRAMSHSESCSPWLPASLSCERSSGNSRDYLFFAACPNEI